MTPIPARQARLALLFATAKVLLQLVALRPYGYFRDELYYLACADHLAFGYVDHPPFSIAMLALWRAVLGDSTVAIRSLSALVGGAVVFLTGRLVTALGGGPIAVALACISVICAPAFVGTDHLYSMNCWDHLFWIASALAVIRAFAAPEKSNKAWLVLGAILGLGLENKVSMLWFGAGLTVALFATANGRAALRARGPWIALGCAAVIMLPHVVWQAIHHWPTAEFAHNAMVYKYVRLSLGSFVTEVVLMMSPAAIPMVIVGLFAPFFVAELSAHKSLALIFGTAFLIVAGSGTGKPEYLNAAFPMVLASGACALENVLRRRGHLDRTFRWVLGAQAIASMAFLTITLPFALPVLTETNFIAYENRLGVKPRTSEKKELGALPQTYADMHGWPELVDEAARAFDALSPEERKTAKIWAVTGGYGPAAAIDVLGRSRGLPRAISTHNDYWLWGYGVDDDAPTILLGGPRDRLEQLFTSLEQVGTVECGYCMPFENHKPIYIGRGMKRRWSDLWPTLKHYE
jgi:Dolichyl-phosphate-mannose-protein mannosyltransferase